MATGKPGDARRWRKSKISKDWIASVVNGDKIFDNVCWGIQSISEEGYHHQSKAVRTFLLRKLNSFFPGDLHVGKTPVGYPVILKGIQNMHIPVSLAHHGHFVAYSFILNSAHKKNIGIRHAWQLKSGCCFWNTFNYTSKITHSRFLIFKTIIS